MTKFSQWLRLQWDRALAVTAMVAGGVLLVLGWVRISDTPYPAEQLPLLLSSGLGGLFLVGIGATFWLSGDLRDEWTKLDSVDEALRDLQGSGLVRPESTAAPAPTSDLGSRGSVARR